MNANHGILQIYCTNTFLAFEDHGGYESRNPSMRNLIKDAWERFVRNEEPTGPPKSFSLYTEDVFHPYCDYSLSCNSGETAHRCMPNFIFDCWPECGIASYEETFLEMIRSGNAPPDDDRVFWIGNVNPEWKRYETRRKALSLAAKNQKMLDFRSIDWKRGPDQVINTRGYVDFPSHCRYRVLIDLGALGFSARLPLLFASGRPVILTGRREEAWFYWDGTLRPWEHYIPCGVDGREITEDDIMTSVSWTFKNPEAAERIGRSGRKYALEHFTRDAAVAKIGKMLLKHPFSKD